MEWEDEAAAQPPQQSQQSQSSISVTSRSNSAAPSTSSPPRGRTANRRQRRIIRTGARALDEARERRAASTIVDRLSQSSGGNDIGISPNKKSNNNNNYASKYFSSDDDVEREAEEEGGEADAGAGQDNAVEMREATSSLVMKSSSRRRHKSKNTTSSKKRKTHSTPEDFLSQESASSNKGGLGGAVGNGNSFKRRKEGIGSNAISKKKISFSQDTKCQSSVEGEHSGSVGIASSEKGITYCTLKSSPGKGTPPSSPEDSATTAQSITHLKSDTPQSPWAASSSVRSSEDTNLSLTSSRKKSPQSTTRMKSNPQQPPPSSSSINTSSTFSPNREQQLSAPIKKKAYKSSYSSFTLKRKESQQSQRFRYKSASTLTLIATLEEPSQSQSPAKSPEETPMVALGAGHVGGAYGTEASSVQQDMGNHRMLVDDLSYLCSAIVHCRARRPPPLQQRLEQLNDEGDGQRDRSLSSTAPSITCKHTAVTAGAAVDIADLLSQPDTRCALLRVNAQMSSQSRADKMGGGRKTATKVGALDAVLESIACAPSSASDASLICRELIECRRCLCRGGKPSATAATQGSIKTVDVVSRDRTKNARRRIFPGSQSAGVAKSEVSVASIPSVSLEVSKYDATSSKALSIVSYFFGLDCTGSDRASILSKGRGNRTVVEQARKCALQNVGALQGIARIVLNDSAVHAYLFHGRDAPGERYDDDSMSRSSAQTENTPSESSVSLPDMDSDRSTAHMDPTKMGRRGRKNRIMRQGTASSSTSFVASSQESKSPSRTKPTQPSFDFTQESTESATISRHEQAENIVGDRYTEKMSSALSRAKLTDSMTNIPIPKRDTISMCAMCSIWEQQMLPNLDQNTSRCVLISPSSLALAAADCIITGKDRFSSSELNSADDISDNDHETFIESDSDGEDSHLLSKNPIVYANEMMRRSGSLAHYAQSMSETLLAILLASKSKCSSCITYLQQRSSTLSEVIDSLCCLSPKASVALSVRESLLVPSLLRTIAELAFATKDGGSSFSGDTIAIALKTLTSLTHENGVACNQIMDSYSWKISLPSSSSRGSSSSSQLSGLEIIFCYLFKVVTSNQEDSGSVELRSHNHDSIIFCLNILTNVVEMVQNEARRKFVTIELDEGLSFGELDTKGLSWLAQWVVSKTSGFQRSVMKGSFGTTGITQADSSELKAGEEANLLTAGNGFVLLAYLMIGDGDDDSATVAVREMILQELPVDTDGNSGGIQFMIKTMKAFCNLYHFSVGDLSVAVIAPVVKLIRGLESMDHEQRQQQNLTDDVGDDSDCMSMSSPNS